MWQGDLVAWRNRALDFLHQAVVNLTPGWVAIKKQLYANCSYPYMCLVTFSIICYLPRGDALQLLRQL